MSAFSVNRRRILSLWLPRLPIDRIKRQLARGNAAKAYEAGIAQRVVVIEFDSVEKAVAAHESEGYQAALKVFGKAAERDMRIVEGLA